MKLAELASLIRSKNAGPFVLTFDAVHDSTGPDAFVLDEESVRLALSLALGDRVRAEDVAREAFARGR